MNSTVRGNRPFVVWVSTSLLWGAGVSLLLSGCGGAPEPVKAPRPTKLVWGSQGSSAEPDDATDVGETLRAGEVDLDAPKAAVPKAAVPKKAAAPMAAAPKAAAPKAAVPKAAVPKAAVPKAAVPKEAPEKDATADGPAAEATARPEASDPEPPPADEPRVEPALAAEMRAAVKSKQKVVAPNKASAKPKKAASKKGAPDAPAASTYSGPNPCKAERFSVPRVRDACAAGGRAAAKAVMKEAISRALAGGGTLKCADCHAEQRDYTLKPDAAAQLQQWLAR